MSRRWVHVGGGWPSCSVGCPSWCPSTGQSRTRPSPRSLHLLPPRNFADTQTRAEAAAHYKGKADFVQNNLETLQKTIERKQENVQSVVQVMQMKLQEQQQAQAQGQTA